MVPDPEYIAIDNSREKFIPLSQSELINCHNLENVNNKTELICLQVSPLMTTTSEDCSGHLLMLQVIPEKCEIRVSNISSQMWIRLQRPNTWIGIFPMKSILYIKCTDFPTFEEHLERTGIIQIHEDYPIKTSHILIRAQKNYTSNV